MFSGDYREIFKNTYFEEHRKRLLLCLSFFFQNVNRNAIYAPSVLHTVLAINLLYWFYEIPTFIQTFTLQKQYLMWINGFTLRKYNSKSYIARKWETKAIYAVYLVAGTSPST